MITLLERPIRLAPQKSKPDIPQVLKRGSKEKTTLALFELINEAKNSSCYSVANYAFACLLSLVGEDCTLYLMWETPEVEKVPPSTYWDLLVITNGKWEACIPAPLLNEKVAQSSLQITLRSKKVITKKDHNRKVKPLLPGQDKYLWGELSKLCPDYLERGEEYLCIK